MAGEFLAKLGESDSVAVTDATSSNVELPGNATRGYRVTAVDVAMFIQLGGSDSVAASPTNRIAALAVNESIEFRSQVDGQSYIAGYGRGGAGTLLVTALDH